MTGPWIPNVTGEIIYSEDFDNDAMLRLDGDFENPSDRPELASLIADTLNTHHKLHAGKATAHWLWVALSRVAAGEDVEQVMRDYGWEKPGP